MLSQKEKHERDMERIDALIDFALILIIAYFVIKCLEYFGWM